MSRGPLVANVSELRSVENLEPVHFRQLLTYLRLSGLRPGLLINFAEAVLKNGIRQIANNLQSETLASWREILSPSLACTRVIPHRTSETSSTLVSSIGLSKTISPRAIATMRSHDWKT
jgi:PD-(D/E)XK nuclease superfamily